MMRNTIQPREYSKGDGMEGILYIIDSDGNRKLFNVKRNDDGKRYLNGNNGNPDNVWNADARFVFRRRNSFHFSPAFAGEFCFSTCPSQPPSILPTSSTGIESNSYFFVSIERVSQSTISNILSVSTTLPPQLFCKAISIGKITDQF
ncbi:MAG: hypothetical protein WAZ40_02640 [Minisyncoccia bacterium]